MMLPDLCHPPFTDIVQLYHNKRATSFHRRGSERLRSAIPGRIKNREKRGGPRELRNAVISSLLREKKSRPVLYRMKV